MTTPAKWYEIKAPQAAGKDQPTVAEIYIYGNIGDRWNEDGVIASEMVREIAALEADEITLRINSYGGSVTDGLAIYNALRRHPAPVNVMVDGVAISCASYIAMAADRITMAQNAQMMIHAPWSFAYGNAVDMREAADILDRYSKSMASAYADKSGKSYEDALAILTDGKDHWFTAEEALAEGFADAVGEQVDAAAALASSFDLSRFRAGATAAAPSSAAPAAVSADLAAALAVAAARPGAAPAASAAATAASAAFAPLAAPAGLTGLAASAAPAAVPVVGPVSPISNPPAAAGNTKEHSMPDPVTAAAQPAAPFARTKEQNVQVLEMMKPFAHLPGVQAFKDEALADPALTMEQIQARLLVEIGKGTEPVNPSASFPDIRTVEDEADKRRAAASDALLVRAGVPVSDQVRANLGGNPFRGAKLLDLARASLERGGRDTRGMDQMQVVASAFTQGTSDFPVLLENTMHKALQAAYGTVALTWNRFCATGSVSDFRAHKRYRMGSFGSLDAKNELGEFINKSIPDGESASITAGTKGNIINLSREAIINDDLGAFVGLSAMLGRAAARTVEADVYALLALNSGLGPTMSDGSTLFHANHGNLTTSAAISMAAIDLDRVAMASQRDVSGNDYLALRPAVLLVPIALGGTARSINEAQYDPDTANKLQRPNFVNGLFRDIVDTPRLSGNRRYLFADPMEAPVLEVAFLDGNQAPYLELQNGFSVDGSQWKVRLDYGVAAVDWRGAVTNAGG